MPLAPGTALRIMTGAALPAGADSIVPLEAAVAVAADWVRLDRPVRPGAHVRGVGEDLAAGGLVVARGSLLRPAEIGALAAIGCVWVPVHPRPRVAVLTTGDELVAAGTRPGPGQIRDANLHALGAQVRAAGGVPLPRPRVPDRREALAQALASALAGAALVLCNGGVSVGDCDEVKGVLAELGAEPAYPTLTK